MTPSKLLRTGAVASLSVSLAISACGQAPPPPKAPPPAPVASSAPSAAPVVEAPDGPVPALRSGTLTPNENPDVLVAHVERRSIEGGMETLVCSVDPGGPNTGMARSAESVAVFIGAPGQPGPVAFAADPSAKVFKPSTLELWLRRPASAAGTPIAGSLYFPATPYNRTVGERRQFRADDPPASGAGALKSDSGLIPLWEQALASHFTAGVRPGPWQYYASAELMNLAPFRATGKKGPEQHRARGWQAEEARQQAMRNEMELASLMETTSGATAVQEALQNNRALFFSADRPKQTIPIASLSGPPLAQHPWGDMLKRLGVKPPAEPLADAAPAEFYYARASSLPTLFRVLDQVDAWGTPASQVFSGAHEDHGIAARYEAQLGLERTEVARTLGPSIVTEVAVVGSDPYVREGSDVTLLFRVRNHALFDAALQATLADYAQKHGAVATSKSPVLGVDVTISKTADLAVMQHRATVGDLEIVSNSPAAIERVIGTTQGKHPSLGGELDFQYMLARDAKAKADVLAYVGDRFVAEVVGPRQKVLEARRQVALGELVTPGFAALLYGAMNGKSPASVDDLFHAKLLTKTQLAHVSGGAIAWKPGEAARSAWGTPAALTPLIDLPQPTLVTAPERDGYARFARGYESDWKTYIDPIALRLTFEPLGNGDDTRMTVDLRELPLIDMSSYRDIAEEAGEARFEADPIGNGGRVVIGIGERSELRKLLSDVRSFSRKHELKFDWMGSWAMLGVLDRSSIAEATIALDRDLPQKPDFDEDRHVSDADLVHQIAKLPLYAAVAVKNPLGATLALAAIKSLADDATPGLVDWGEAGTYRDVAVVRVGVNSKRAKEEFGEEVAVQFFYALTQGALVVSLSEATLHHLIDDRLDGKGPKSPADAEKAGNANREGAQFALELASDKGKGLWTSLMWQLEYGVVGRDSSLAARNAEALLRGAPESASDPAAMRALAFAYFGAAPLTPDGAAFSLAPEGVRDPFRGTPYAPSWPPLPVKGSPVDALMTAIAHARGELSFDDEGELAQKAPTSQTSKGPKMTSLHARLTMDLKGR
ncbi:MAG: hypothetical protein ACLQVI_09205 [Polyangiaceae bacterium]